MSKIDSSLFSMQEHALDKEYRLCPECGGALSLRRSKHGLFLGCDNYPACQYIRPLQQQNVQIEKVLDDSKCPECGKPLAIKKGRFGLFIGCTGYPECTHIETNSSVDASANAERLPACPLCHGQLQAKISRYGKTFYACSNYPKCKYAINDKPVAATCPDCGSSILVERKSKNGIRYCCARKECTYSTDSL
ncbi:type I DNA topoisomerase [Tolumonas lignilytica]|jgi:Zn-finger domain associated with topoisomerase type I|uniref:DNA topoisomerase family protein n=1 Tax=Tolumonas lignilytica TaxID=1283284 RepID=UPI0004678BDC|nr:topoisomerase DNA-binding C4 zinc finger domain-containing protein [Tolumonas lignilytica]